MVLSLGNLLSALGRTETMSPLASIGDILPATKRSALCQEETLAVDQRSY